MDMAEKDATEGRCPACRTPYDKDRIVGLETKFQRLAASSSSRKQKQPKLKQKPTEEKKDLSNVRVIQRKMAYIIGLPLSLADEDLLKRKDYFGQYGKVTKVSLSRTAGGTVQQFVNDTCSVYVTFSKEEEAVRCIQSVHGYVLDGRFLRASFGTAKYCHAWLKNMPCNNFACLYLHSIGAEEDSFGKDETAAVHTRNRVQEIVGATQYLNKRAGTMLPPPVDGHLNNPIASAEEPVFNSGLKDVAFASVASGDHLPCSKDSNGLVKSSTHMTSFVDIVGRSCNSGSDKDVSSGAKGQRLNLPSDISSLCINRSNHDKAEGAESVSSKSSTPGQITNGTVNSKLYSEPFREGSKLVDLTLEDTKFTKDQSGLALDPHNFLNPHSSEVIDNSSDHAWWRKESCSENGYGVNSYADEEFKQHSTCTDSVLNDGYNEEKFESLVKSDRIYRCSKPFSNEEIVEHLRRLDDANLVNDDNDENSAAVESSIISNILSMDFDECDDLVLPQTVARSFDGKDGQHGSWNFQNSDQSRFSFANNQGNINYESEKQSVFHDFRENQDCVYKPQYQASRAQSVTPPGFSKPPPGFPTCMRTEQFVSTGSGSYAKNCVPSNHYRRPSIGNSSNSSDDLIDPAIMVVGRGQSPSPSLDMRSTSYDEETKLWLLSQQREAAVAPVHHQTPQFSQTSFMPQHPTPQFRDSYYGNVNSRIVDQRLPSYTQQQYAQPKFANSHLSNGYQQLHLDEGQQLNSRSELGLAEQIQRNERLGLKNLSPGYGDYRFQVSNSGDVYTRVFGM
ncbi:uncharacterized protein [Rutidosis leptorrhynchoides]